MHSFLKAKNNGVFTANGMDIFALLMGGRTFTCHHKANSHLIFNLAPSDA